MRALLTKMERFRAAVAGERVDRIPVTLWLHMGTEHLPGDETAALYVKYAKEYDFDFLKVMNDYRLPLPPGLTNVETADHLRRFTALSMDERPFREQLLVLRELRRLMGPDFPFIDTIFSPLQVIQRTAGQDVFQVIQEHPEAGLEALEVVTEMMCAYVRRVAETGAAGIYFSVDGAGRPEAGGMSEELFRRFVEPFDLRVLAAAEGLVKVIHVHGKGLEFHRVQRYPADVWSWSHHHTEPTLFEVRRQSKAAILAGINRERVSRQTAAQLEADIRATAKEAGTRGLLIGPGCTIPTDTPRRLLHHAVAVARSLEPA